MKKVSQTVFDIDCLSKLLDNYICLLLEFLHSSTGCQHKIAHYRERDRYS